MQIRAGQWNFLKMCWSKNSKTLSWLGVLWGLLSLATLLTAFLSNVWLYTKEPIRFSNNDILTTVTFKIGLWRICPTFKRANATPCKYHWLSPFSLLCAANSKLKLFVFFGECGGGGREERREGWNNKFSLFPVVQKKKKT